MGGIFAELDSFSGIFGEFILISGKRIFYDASIKTPLIGKFVDLCVSKFKIVILNF